MLAFIFVPLLAATTIFAFVLWVYLSHAFLTVVEDSAAGNAEVRLPDDPYQDWVWKGGYLAWLIAVWLTPALLIAHILAPLFSEPYRVAGYVLIAAVAFWITFPVSLLSSLAAQSRWAILHPGIFARLARRIGEPALFYLWSVPVVALGAAAFGWLVVDKGYLSLFAGPFGVVAALLLYARFAGVLANHLQFVPLPKRSRAPAPRRKKRKSRAEVIDPWATTHASPESEAEFVQPSRMPGLHTPFEGEVTGYDVAIEDPVTTPEPPLAAGVRRVEPLPDPDRVRYDPDHDRARDHARNIQPDELELSSLRRRADPIPRLEWGASVLAFPIARASMQFFAALVLGFILLGVLVRALRATWPL